MDPGDCLWRFSAHGYPCAVCPYPDDHGIRKQPLQCRAGKRTALSGGWKNSVIAYLRDRLNPHKQIPFVEDYKIVFHGPFHAEVIIYDKSIVGYVSYMSSYMYFDREGIVVESSGRKLEGVLDHRHGSGAGGALSASSGCRQPDS